MFNQSELERQKTRQQLDLLRLRLKNAERKRQRLRAKLREVAAEKARIRTALWKLQNPDRVKAKRPTVQVEQPALGPIPSADPADYRPAWLKPPQDVDNS